VDIPGVKQESREADHTPLRAQVRNDRTIPELPICLHAIVLNYNKYKDNFTLIEIRTKTLAVSVITVYMRFQLTQEPMQ
jgi:hypothetical protein